MQAAAKYLFSGGLFPIAMWFVPLWIGISRLHQQGASLRRRFKGGLLYTAVTLPFLAAVELAGLYIADPVVALTVGAAAVLCFILLAWFGRTRIEIF
jgi:hypothetical protein